MKRLRFFGSVLLLVFLLGVLPAMASAWRSTSGNIFRFQNNGACSFLAVNGNVLNGSWWWKDQCNAVFQYQFPGYPIYTVKMNSQNSATTWGPNGSVTYWNRLSGRGASSEDEKDRGAESGWMTVRQTP